MRTTRSLLSLQMLFCTFTATESFARSPCSLGDVEGQGVSKRRLSNFVLLEAASSASKETMNGETSQIQKRVTPNARFIAARALMESTTRRKAEFSLRRLDTDEDLPNLEVRDRRFARALVSTVERRKGQIDKLLFHCMEKYAIRPSRRADALVQAALRLGVAQILFLEIPPHAAVKETVDVLRMDIVKISEPKIKLVNAVLRRIGREGKEILEALTSPYDNIAPWLVSEWRDTWGEEKLAAIADAAMTESPIYLSINHSPQSSSADRRQKLKDVQQAFQQRLFNASLRLDGNGDENFEDGIEILEHGSIYLDKTKFPGAVSNWPLYKEGDWWVQDASAALPAIALRNALQSDTAISGDDNDQIKIPIIADLCAAPGGKTAQLLSLGFPSVYAVELSPRRARQLKSNMERLNMQNRCIITVEDGNKWCPPEGPETIDGILLDVPCTATGTASRRPDVLRRDNDLGDILQTQDNLITHCVENLLAPGGIMVYSTCSLLRRESESQVEKLLTRYGSTKLKPLPFTKGEIPGFDEAIDDAGNLRVIPGWMPGNLSFCDGFYVARFQKQKQS